MKKICVFCGASFGDNKIYAESTEKLGDAFIKNKLTLVYGGAKIGLMGKVADYMLDKGGEVIGIIPQFLIGKGVVHRGLTRLITVRSLHERKFFMQKESDGFIALPGGLGTLEEIFEMIAWGQLSLHQKPCAFFNVNGFYKLMDDFLVNAVKEGFVEKEFRDMIIIESDINIIIERFFNYVHPEIDKAKIALSKTHAREKLS